MQGGVCARGATHRTHLRRWLSTRASLFASVASVGSSRSEGYENGHRLARQRCSLRAGRPRVSLTGCSLVPRASLRDLTHDPHAADDGCDEVDRLDDLEHPRVLPARAPVAVVRARPQVQGGGSPRHVSWNAEEGGARARAAP